MREAPALKVIEMLYAKGAQVSTNNPEAMKNARRIYEIQLEDSQYKCLEGADAPNHRHQVKQYRAQLKRMKALLRHPFVFDGRNIYTPESMRQLGFTYSCIGRKSAIVDIAPFRALRYAEPSCRRRRARAALQRDLHGDAGRALREAPAQHHADQSDEDRAG